ncbi:TetR/AcrR family transcriptional regulator [Frigoribacterium sp. 2-23]|uniref:TetR/AcrR family transcriptional regulator n=1 Tax=Frigoribacterium sp. 2-23 TaxID=3415006 RepID=UPI003C6F44A2
MIDPTGAAPGLRERKRLATRRAIQVAVLELVADHGVDGVTVDMISRRADVSPRTFFNYFASKEDAIVGDAPDLPMEAADAFVVGQGPLLDDLLELLDESVQTVIVDRELVRRRRLVLRAHPDLFARRVASMREYEEGLSKIVERRLAEAPAVADSGDDESSVASRAHLVALVVMAALRHAWAEWLDDDDEHHADVLRFGLRARMEASIGDLRRLVSREV